MRTGKILIKPHECASSSYLRWAHKSEDLFVDVAAHIILTPWANSADDKIPENKASYFEQIVFSPSGLLTCILDSQKQDVTVTFVSSELTR